MKNLWQSRYEKYLVATSKIPDIRGGSPKIWKIFGIKKWWYLRDLGRLKIFGSHGDMKNLWQSRYEKYLVATSKIPDIRGGSPKIWKIFGIKKWWYLRDLGRLKIFGSHGDMKNLWQSLQQKSMEVGINAWKKLDFNNLKNKNLRDFYVMGYLKDLRSFHF